MGAAGKNQQVTANAGTALGLAAAAVMKKGEIHITDDGSTVIIESCKSKDGCAATTTTDRLVGEVIID